MWFSFHNLVFLFLWKMCFILHNSFARLLQRRRTYFRSVRCSKILVSLFQILSILYRHNCGRRDEKLHDVTFTNRIIEMEIERERQCSQVKVAKSLLLKNGKHCSRQKNIQCLHSWDKHGDDFSDKISQRRRYCKNRWKHYIFSSNLENTGKTNAHFCVQKWFLKSTIWILLNNSTS